MAGIGFSYLKNVYTANETFCQASLTPAVVAPGLTCCCKAFQSQRLETSLPGSDKKATN